jgi:hypothetical protein
MSLADEIEQSRIALALISSLIIGTDKNENKAHDISPAPICVWEENTDIDTEHAPGYDGPKGDESAGGTV